MALCMAMIQDAELRARECFVTHTRTHLCAGLDFHAPAFEDHGAIGECEQGVILATADEATRFKWGAALTDDDRAGLGPLAAVQFHAAILRIAISPVA